MYKRNEMIFLQTSELKVSNKVKLLTSEAAL